MWVFHLISLFGSNVLLHKFILVVEDSTPMRLWLSDTVEAQIHSALFLLYATIFGCSSTMFLILRFYRTARKSPTIRPYLDPRKSETQAPSSRFMKIQAGCYGLWIFNFLSSHDLISYIMKKNQLQKPSLHWIEKGEETKNQVPKQWFNNWVGQVKPRPEGCPGPLI